MSSSIVLGSDSVRVCLFSHHHVKAETQLATQRWQSLYREHKIPSLYVVVANGLWSCEEMGMHVMCGYKTKNKFMDPKRLYSHV